MPERIEESWSLISAPGEKFDRMVDEDEMLVEEEEEEE